VARVFCNKMIIDPKKLLDLELQKSALGFFDKLILFRWRAYAKFKLTRVLSLILVRDTDTACVLKFAYPGNVQFHALKFEDLKTLSKTLYTVTLECELASEDPIPKDSPN
jgi:hypothetical protein